MKHTQNILLLTLLTCISTSAIAQNFDRGRGGTITLYSGVNFSGERRVINRDIDNLQSINFDEAAGSLVAIGEWQVCLDPNYGSRCRIYSNEVPNLESFKGRISSVRYMGRQNNYGNNYSNNYGNSGPSNNYRNDYRGNIARGANTVFYPGAIPNSRASQTEANDFCKSQGQSYAVYFSGYSNLEDVLCKK